MPKVAEVKPMDIRFDDEQAEAKFIRWATETKANDSSEMVKVRRMLQEVRSLTEGIESRGRSRDKNRYSEH